ncbi:MAG TPA: PA domain-containing protein [Steroidobacteraceae bacterium]|nr:PA domain-containing protein [Steroidobacteraceae bacterium]
MRTFIYGVAAAAAMSIGGVSAAFAQGHIIIQNANAPGVGFNDPTPAVPVGGNPGTTLGQQRLNVFNHAAQIWEAVLQPRVDVIVNARFTALGAGVLGSAGPTFIFDNFAGAEYPDTWYHSALADHLAGVDLEPGQPDIAANFSSDTLFYLGFDTNEPAGTSDLLPVVLHELGHGLGFSNFIDDTTGELADGEVDIYSKYTLDVTTGKTWDAMTDAERAASSINVRKVSWNGINVTKDIPKVLEFGEPFFRNVTANGPLLMIGPASFGPALTIAGTTAQVVVGIDDTAAPGPSTTDACSPLTNDLTGKIALVDRGGCTFVVKVKNAQNAGAIAVLVADNAPGAPPAGLGGTDPTITIFSGRIQQVDGAALKTQLTTQNVTVRIGRDTSIRAGTDRVKGLAMVAALNPVQPGSSISHWDTAAIPNQLMEPAINADLTSSVTTPRDLTASQMTDIGWFSDGDGVPDGKDDCIGSDTRPTVVIGRCNSRAGNDVQANGCTVADDIDQCDIDFAKKPLHYLACVIKETDRLRRARVITAKEGAAILVCSLLGR